ncbi:hypothetical protein EVAR_44934_1 [Eumeta japonica]|uniref:Uncharacterized protein n=1 Tax=Eumeta variegata TaxID=151549 RepID=A0A4C2AFI0_EUMVA|nr:hypothetical protein EVAR_44934_1 [Eumeta japonica]
MHAIAGHRKAPPRTGVGCRKHAIANRERVTIHLQTMVSPACTPICWFDFFMQTFSHGRGPPSSASQRRVSSPPLSKHVQGLAVVNGRRNRYGDNFTISGLLLQ